MDLTEWGFHIDPESGRWLDRDGFYYVDLITTDDRAGDETVTTVIYDGYPVLVVPADGMVIPVPMPDRYTQQKLAAFYEYIGEESEGFATHVADHGIDHAFEHVSTGDGHAVYDFAQSVAAGRLN